MSLQVLSKLELPTARNDILRRQGRHEDAEGDGFEWEVGLGLLLGLLLGYCCWVTGLLLGLLLGYSWV